MNNINTLLSGPWQTAINDEIAILKERISLLQSKKYTLGLLERLDMEELPEEVLIPARGLGLDFSDQ